MRQQLGLWLPVAVVATVMFTFSHLSRPPRPSATPDWLLHGVEFAVLGFFVLRALAGGLHRRARGSVVAAALALTALFGVTDEFHQSLVPAREADVRDVAADGAGAAAGIALAMASSRFVQPRTRRMASGIAPLRVRLVTGPHCSLCDDARRAVRRLAHRFPLALEEVSVADDPRLKNLYGFEVPVILVNGRRVSKGRVDEARLTASFKARMTMKERSA